MKQHKFDANVLEQLINTSPAAMFIVDKERNMLFANKSYADMFGYTQEEILHVNARVFHISDESYERFAKIAFNAVKEGKPVSTSFPAKKKDGTHFWIHIVGSLVEDQDLILWTMIDITEQKEAEARLEKMNFNFSQYLKVIDDIEIGIFVVDEDYTVRFMNNTMTKWFGDQQGKICYSSVANLDAPCPYCKLSEVLEYKEKVIYEPVTPNGESFHIVATSIQNPDGTYSKMEVIRNVTKEKENEAKMIEQRNLLEYQATHDTLTHLKNRKALQERLEEALSRSKRNHTKTALLFIDLDRFKEINDSLGHDIGDKVLIEVAKRLQKSVRKEDVIARLGGDEFTIIVEEIEDENDIASLASKLVQIFSSPLEIDGYKLYLSCSIGISLYPDDGVDVSSLLKFADSAMYKAKAEGRNNFQFYSKEMTKHAFEQIVMQTDLKSALENEEFEVYFQPQVNGITYKFVGVEALIRWRHPKHGLLSPIKFIPIAEKTGLIVEIDRFVMHKAMQEFKKWEKKGYAPNSLSLNLAVKQLYEKDFIEFLQNSLEKFDFDPKKLELEVIESQIMKRPQEAVKILNAISKMGIKIAVDDFGTGYSSLSYLKKFPIDKLKIDRSFIKDIPGDEEDKAITKAIIAMSKSLSLVSIAEGVETEEQKRFVLENGCDLIQGYLYAKPLSSGEIEDFAKSML